MPTDGEAAGQAGVLALDLGATNLRCGIVDERGSVLVRESIHTPAGPALATTMADLARRVLGTTEVTCAVVGVPGRVDYANGTLEWGRGQPPEWREVLTETTLGHLFGLSVSLANDADLATVGEATFGAGSGHRDVAYITISSGVGVGALTSGRLFRGRAKLCEVGLTLLGLPGSLSGSPTLLEDLASGHGLEDAARRAGFEGSAEEVAAATAEGNAVARRLWDTYTLAVAAAAVNVAHLLLPEVIVFGGGVSRVGEMLLEPVREWLTRYGPQGLPQPIEVRVAALADDAGLVGAAAWRSVIDSGDVGR